MPLRRPSSPCSGRGALGSVVSHLGPPTAPSRTASEARQAASTSSVRAVPWASIEQPPSRRWSNSNSPSDSSSCCAAATISGPIPSPGRTTMRGGVLTGRPLYALGCPFAPLITAKEQRGSAGDGLDVEANVLEPQRLRLGLEDGGDER